MTGGRGVFQSVEMKADGGRLPSGEHFGLMQPLSFLYPSAKEQSFCLKHALDSADDAVD